MSAPNRREVLACLACTCALAACAPLGGTGGADDTGTDTGGDDTGGGDTGADPTGIDGGHVDEYAVGDLDPVGHGVAVGLDEGGFFAISTVCTHRGCDMASRGEVDGSGLICDCHGSRFNVDGSVRRGPARTPLPFYALVIDETGAISVDKETEVDADARVQGPSVIG